MHRSLATLRSQRGSTVVEFALSVLVLLSLVFGVMDFGRALSTYHAVCYAAREGARFAMVNGSASNSPATAPTIATYAKNASSLTPSALNYDPQSPDTSAGTMNVYTTWNPNNKAGSTVQVKVQYNYKFMFPLLPSAPVTLSSTSQMVISQ
jgi:Flp pilus assembly protein TadG